jgi:hypothetical protein
MLRHDFKVGKGKALLLIITLILQQSIWRLVEKIIKSLGATHLIFIFASLEIKEGEVPEWPKGTVC